MPGQVFGLGAGGLGWQVQWLAFVGFEVLGHGRFSEMVAKRRGADKAELGIEGDEATIESLVVKGVEGDAVLWTEELFNRIWIRCSLSVPWHPHARRNSRQP